MAQAPVPVAGSGRTKVALHSAMVAEARLIGSVM